MSSDFDLRGIDYYFVTDSGLSKKGTLSDVAKVVEAGCRIVQYREKNKSTREMIEEAREIKKLCGNAIFLVNDRVDVALAVDADGVHIGQDDMPFVIARKLLGIEKIIGLTVHNIEESLEAERMGADYLGLSPIFDTSTKSDAGMGCGVTMIRKVRDISALPIVSIGGINMENVAEVITAGSDSAAAISAVVCSDDVCKAAAGFIEIIRRGKK